MSTQPIQKWLKLASMRTVIFEGQTRQLVAANVRARLAWSGLRQVHLMARFGWSKRTAYNKLTGVTGFSDDELSSLAELFGLKDPGPLFRVPEGFPISVSESAWTRRPRHLWLVAA